MSARWLAALGAVGIHVSIGSVYAWSVLTKPIMEIMNVSMKDATWAFSLAILFLGFSAGFLGTFVERIGPRKSGMLAAMLFGAGMLGTSLAVSWENILLVYFFYGCIGGIGLGIGYITPVSTLVKHFPNHKGFATGLAIMGFGFAALLAGPVMQRLVEKFGLAENFVVMGLCYMVVMMISSRLLKPPETEENPSSKVIAVQQRGATPKEAMHTWQFLALWWVFFVNITCGIGLLAVASPMAQEIIGMDATQAAALVGIVGLLNGGGRIVWSSISDYLGRGSTYASFFLIEMLAFMFLSGAKDFLLFHILVLLIISCYGGGFSCMPAYLSDLFGTKHLSAIHGRILTAWGLAGIAGPTVISVMHDRTDGYAATMELFAACFLINLVVSLALRHSLSKKKKREEIVCLI